ncbi:MAG: hypothetical protein ACYTFA_09070 [Planctomycetota bacterium]|jgi:hypothetical protein
MIELQATPNATGRQVQDSDDCFDVVIGPSGIGPGGGDFIPVPKELVPPVPLSAATAADWVAATFLDTAVFVPSVIDDSELGGMFLSRAEAEFVRQIRNDLDELSESIRSSHSVELCRQFVEGVSMALANDPEARCAVFGDEEDGVTLVAHSRASRRQVSFEFGLEGDSISIVSIDEEMRRSERACGIDKVRTLREAIAWLNPP